MCEADERSWFPRVFNSATPYRPFFFFLGGSTDAMVRRRRGSAAAQGLVLLLFTIEGLGFRHRELVTLI